jgi:hypothetical protein
MTKPRKKRRKSVRRWVPATPSFTSDQQKEIISIFNDLIGPPRYPPPGRHEVLVVKAREASRPGGDLMIRLVLKVEHFDTFLAHLFFGGVNDYRVAAFKASIEVSRVEVLEELIGRIGYAELFINDKGFIDVKKWLTAEEFAEVSPRTAKDLLNGVGEVPPF